MANEEATAEEAPPPARTKKLVLGVILVGGLVVGGGVGALVAGPMLTKPPTPLHAALEGEDGAREATSRSRREGPPIVYLVENLVLNPAGTGGTRFLMAAVAFDLRDAKLQDQLRGRDPEVRDLMLRTFGEKTVEELSDIAGRESLKEELRRALEAVLEPGAVRTVYLPQFVIQ